MKNPTLITAAIALGGLTGLTAGINLPHAQAQAVAPPTSGADLAQRSQLLDLAQRVTALENQVKSLEQQRLADKTTTLYTVPPPASGVSPLTPFGPVQPPDAGSGMPHVRPPAYIWPAVK